MAGVPPIRRLIVPFALAAAVYAAVLYGGLSGWLPSPLMPILIFVPVGILVAVFIERPLRERRRRGRLGLCLKCGYDLRGNISGVCPECGTTAG
jgi:hypothetical protein